MQTLFEAAVREIELAEKIAPAGSYEHSQYVKSALMMAWPTIKLYAEFQRRSPSDRPAKERK